jgi:hypothetical protein
MSTLMMEAVISETSVSIYHNTRRSIPEDSHIHSRRRENLKSHEPEALQLYQFTRYYWFTGNKY